jgi:hypothetical protein
MDLLFIEWNEGNVLVAHGVVHRDREEEDAHGWSRLSKSNANFLHFSFSWARPMGPLQNVIFE